MSVPTGSVSSGLYVHWLSVSFHLPTPGTVVVQNHSFVMLSSMVDRSMSEC